MHGVLARHDTLSFFCFIIFYTCPKHTRQDNVWLVNHVKSTNSFFCLFLHGNKGGNDQQEKENDVVRRQCRKMAAARV
jgi:hypothetical protein